MMEGERIVEDEMHGECGHSSEGDASGQEEDLISPSTVGCPSCQEFESTETADERNSIGENDETTVEMLGELDKAFGNLVIPRSIDGGERDDGTDRGGRCISGSEIHGSGSARRTRDAHDGEEGWSRSGRRAGTMKARSVQSSCFADRGGGDVRNAEGKSVDDNRVCQSSPRGPPRRRR